MNRIPKSRGPAWEPSYRTGTGRSPISIWANYHGILSFLSQLSFYHNCYTHLVLHYMMIDSSHFGKVFRDKYIFAQLTSIQTNSMNNYEKKCSKKKMKKKKWKNEKKKKKCLTALTSYLNLISWLVIRFKFQSKLRTDDFVYLRIHQVSSPPEVQSGYP